MKIWTYITRHRAVFLLAGTVLAVWGSLASDPDSGLATALGGLAMLQGIWAVTASHWVRKKLLDYPSADMSKLFDQAGKESTGAGLALIAIAIMFVGLLLVFSPRAHAAEQLPAGAVKYMPVLKAEQVRLWPDHPRPALLASLVEQESCISLRSRGCWNPGAQLKTEREEGAGVGQITRAYRADGGVRFDALADLRRQYSDELAELTWANVYGRADLQLRALVLMSRDSARQFRQAPAMLEFGDAGYNGGPAGVRRERRACALAKGCDPGLWFGNVELHCLKSRQPLYGCRSACDINREHVRNVFKVRPAMYLTAWAAI